MLRQANNYLHFGKKCGKLKAGAGLRNHQNKLLLKLFTASLNGGRNNTKLYRLKW
jgi:hypothetical protein